MNPPGRFLNHVELLHRPGELDLALAFVETLGFYHEDLTSVFGATRRIIGIFAGTGDRDPVNDVLYLSEFRQPDIQLDDLLRTVAKDNSELRAALDEHDAMRRRAGDVTHFGLLYDNEDDLKAAVYRLQHELPESLTGRVTVAPTSSVPIKPLGVLATQGFVHTDVIGTGLFPFGQLIELQAQTPLAA